MAEIKVTVVKFPDRDNLMLRFIDPMTGKPKHKTAGTTDRKQATKAAGKWEAELREGRYQAPLKTTWAAFRARYEDEAFPQLARRTEEVRSTVMDHVERILAPYKIEDLTADRLSFFQAELRKPDARTIKMAEGVAAKAKAAVEAASKLPQSQTTGRRPVRNRLAQSQHRLRCAERALVRARRTKSEATIKGNLAHLRAILSWAVQIGMLRTVPSLQLPTRNLRGGLVRGRPVTGEEFDRMLGKVHEVRTGDAERWERYLRGLWLSGLRLEESLRLTWDADAEFTVDLSGKFPRFRIYAEAEKGHKDRLLPMTPDFAELLLAVPAAERFGPAFPLSDRPGKQRDSKGVGRTIQKIGELAGVVVNREQGKFATAHDLRRSFGTRWASRVKPATLQLLMRHSSIDTTLKYYVAQDADDVASELWRHHNQPARKTEPRALDANRMTPNSVSEGPSNR